MNETIISNLTKIGLTDKEAKVYLAALEGTATIYDLATKSNLKRPTVYLIVDTLMHKGLLSRSDQGKKTFYKAIEPVVLKELAEKQVQAIDHILPELQNLASVQKGRPRVELFEGRAGTERVYRELLEQPEVLFWSNIEGVMSEYPEILDAYLKRVKKGLAKGRELVEDTPAGRKYARQIKKELSPNHETRITTNHVIAGDSFIYGNVVVMVSLKEHNLFVVRIENEDFANSLRTLFDLAWQSAKNV